MEHHGSDVGVIYIALGMYNDGVEDIVLDRFLCERRGRNNDGIVRNMCMKTMGEDPVNVVRTDSLKRILCYVRSPR
jgi:hypothetical protein